MEWYLVLAIVSVGVIVGFINTLAGSGSLLSLPLLMFLGLPATTANGTNRIGILFQSITAVAGFRKHKILSLSNGRPLWIAATIGVIPGAIFASQLNDEIMKIVIGVLLILMFFMILYKPKRWLQGSINSTQKHGLAQLIIFFGIGLYGGFIQAGVGFFLLSGLVLSAGYDLVKANAIKVLIVFLYTPITLIIFWLNDDIAIVPGLLLGLGNIVGAWIATKIAVEKGARFVRWLLLLAIFASTLQLLGVYTWLWSVFT